MGGWLPSHDAVGETGPGSSNICAIALNIQKAFTYAPLQVGEVELYDAAGTLIPRSSLTAALNYVVVEGSNGPADKCIDGEARLPGSKVAAPWDHAAAAGCASSAARQGT
jgi:hypothetical protein